MNFQKKRLSGVHRGKNVVVQGSLTTQIVPAKCQGSGSAKKQLRGFGESGRAANNNGEYGKSRNIQTEKKLRKIEKLKNEKQT